MFHGCLFDNNYLILCVILGWLLWAGLLNKKVPICGALLGRILNLLKAFLCLLVSCRARPGIPSYPRSRDVTCYVWWSEYEIAGQVRNDTVNERFGKNLEGFSKKKRTELMQKTVVFVAQTNALVHKNGVKNVFLEAILVCTEITHTFASGKWTFSLSSFTSFFNVVLTIGLERMVW